MLGGFRTLTHFHSYAEHLQVVVNSSVGHRLSPGGNQPDTLSLMRAAGVDYDRPTQCLKAPPWSNGGEKHFRVVLLSGEREQLEGRTL